MNEKQADEMLQLLRDIKLSLYAKRFTNVSEIAEGGMPKVSDEGIAEILDAMEKTTPTYETKMIGQKLDYIYRDFRIFVCGFSIFAIVLLSLI